MIKIVKIELDLTAEQREWFDHIQKVFSITIESLKNGKSVSVEKTLRNIPQFRSYDQLLIKKNAKEIFTISNKPKKDCHQIITAIKIPQPKHFNNKIEVEGFGTIKLKQKIKIQPADNKFKILGIGNKWFYLYPINKQIKRNNSRSKPIEIYINKDGITYFGNHVKFDCNLDQKNSVNVMTNALQNLKFGSSNYFKLKERMANKIRKMSDKNLNLAHHMVNDILSSCPESVVVFKSDMKSSNCSLARKFYVVLKNKSEEHGINLVVHQPPMAHREEPQEKLPISLLRKQSKITTLRGK